MQITTVYRADGYLDAAVNQTALPKFPDDYRKVATVIGPQSRADVASSLQRQVKSRFPFGGPLGVGTVQMEPDEEQTLRLGDVFVSEHGYVSRYVGIERWEELPEVERGDRRFRSTHQKDGTYRRTYEWGPPEHDLER